jgi:hypothetical protein
MRREADVRWKLFKMKQHGSRCVQGRSSVRISAGVLAILREGFSWFFSVPPDKCRHSTSMRTRSLAWKLFPIHYSQVITTFGRAITQAVSRRFPNATARVRVQLRSCGICCGQSGTWEGFLRVLRFPLPILFPPTAPHSSLSITRGCYNRPISGRRTKWTHSHPTPRN